MKKLFCMLCCAMLALSAVSCALAAEAGELATATSLKAYLPTVGWDDYTMACSDLPRPEFIDAMKALIQDVVSLCELPDKDAEDRITVRSVTWSYSDEDIQGAVISAQRKLYNSVAPMNINTPHKPYQPYNETCEDPDPDMILPEDTIERLDKLEEECQYYIDGDRAQMKLFEEESL